MLCVEYICCVTLLYIYWIRVTSQVVRSGARCDPTAPVMPGNTGRFVVSHMPTELPSTFQKFVSVPVGVNFKLGSN